jgi:hypothetical protein
MAIEARIMEAHGMAHDVLRRRFTVIEVVSGKPDEMREADSEIGLCIKIAVVESIPP